METNAKGFIRQIRVNGEGDNLNYFADVSLILGRDKYQYCSLLVSKSLHKFAAIHVGDSLKKNVIAMTILGLYFEPTVYKGNPYLKNDGILIALEFGGTYSPPKKEELEGAEVEDNAALQSA